MARKKVQDGNTVKVHYQGKLKDGTIFDQTTPDRPLHFMLGQNEIIKGFEEAVLGMKEGDKKTVTIPYPKAYGAHQAKLVEKIPRDSLPEGLQLKVGNHLEITTEKDQIMRVLIVAMDDNSVTLDANHPLAGQDLTFEIELLEICKKSETIPPFFLGALTRH